MSCNRASFSASTTTALFTNEEDPRSFAMWLAVVIVILCQVETTNSFCRDNALDCLRRMPLQNSLRGRLTANRKDKA
jgi:hypothetical protein